MRNKFLAVDIGNTSITIGVFKGSRVFKELRISSRKKWKKAEVGKNIKEFLDSNGLNYSEFYGCGLSSVVPKLTKRVINDISNLLNVKPLNIDHKLDLGIDLSGVDFPALGADRICVSAASYYKYGGPAIIIDLGTATTFDLISKNGLYLGGIIMPGLELSANSLFQKTAKLPRIDLKFPKKIVGTDTISNIQSGIMFGSLFCIEGLVNQIKKESKIKMNVIATGGLSKVLLKKSKIIDIFDSNLVLDGIKRIFERNR
jgi:type III pantothenate kinase